MPDTYFGTWEDLSDPEARQDAEADAREDSLVTADPPPAECPSCGDETLQGCCVCRPGRPLTDDDADDPGFGRPR